MPAEYKDLIVSNFAFHGLQLAMLRWETIIMWILYRKNWLNRLRHSQLYVLCMISEGIIGWSLQGWSRGYSLANSRTRSPQPALELSHKRARPLTFCQRASQYFHTDTKTYRHNSLLAVSLWTLGCCAIYETALSAQRAIKGAEMPSELTVFPNQLRPALSLGLPHLWLLTSTHKSESWHWLLDSARAFAMVVLTFNVHNEQGHWSFDLSCLVRSWVAFVGVCRVRWLSAPSARSDIRIGRVVKGVIIIKYAWENWIYLGYIPPPYKYHMDRSILSSRIYPLALIPVTVVDGSWESCEGDV